MSDERSKRVRFGEAVLVVVVVAFLGSSISSPPDPFTQVLWTVPALVVGIVLAAVLVWVFEYDRIRFGGRELLSFVLLLFVGSLPGILYVERFGPLLGPELIVGGYLALLLAAWLSFAGGLTRLRASVA